MAALLAAIEKGHNPTPLEIVHELQELPDESGVCYGRYISNVGADSKEDFIAKLLSMLKSQWAQ